MGSKTNTPIRMDVPLKDQLKDYFTDDEGNVDMEYYKLLSKKKVQQALGINDVEEATTTVEENLPELLGSKSTAAYAIGAQHELKSVWRGGKQLLGIDEEEMEREEEILGDLYSDPEYGGEAAAGAITGAVVEPASLLLLRGAKVANIAKAASIAVRAGKGEKAGIAAMKAAGKESAKVGGIMAGYGFTVFNDENTLESRAENALLFGGIGAAATGILSTFSVRKAAIAAQEARSRAAYADVTSSDDLINVFLTREEAEHAQDVEKVLGNIRELDDATRTQLIETLKGVDDLREKDINTFLTTYFEKNARDIKFDGVSVDTLTEAAKTHFKEAVSKRGGIPPASKAKGRSPKKMGKKYAATDPYLTGKYESNASKRVETEKGRVLATGTTEGLHLSSKPSSSGGASRRVEESLGVPKSSPVDAEKGRMVSTLGIPPSSKPSSSGGPSKGVAAALGEPKPPTEAPKPMTDALLGRSSGKGRKGRTEGGFIDTMLASRIAMGGAGATYGYGEEEDIGMAMLFGMAGLASPSVAKALWNSGKRGREIILERSSHKLLDEVETKWAYKVLEGKPLDDVFTDITNEYGMRLIDRLTVAAQVTGRKPSFATTEETAKFLIARNKPGGAMSKASEFIVNVANPLQQHVPKVYKALMESEQRVKEISAIYYQEVDQFLHFIGKLSNKEKLEFEDAYFSSSAKKMDTFISKYGEEGRKLYDKYLKVMDDIGDNMVNYGLIESKFEFHFPRNVVKYDQLVKHLPINERRLLDNKISALTKKLGNRSPTGEEISTIINSMVAGKQISADFITGFARGRQFVTVPEKLRKYYSSPVKTIHSFIDQSVRQMEKARLFGREAYVTVDEFGVVTKRKLITDLEKTVGDFLRKDNDAMHLSNREFNDIRKIIQTAYNEGERAPMAIVQMLRDISNGVLLGNPISAMVNLSDTATPVYTNGVANTAKAAVAAATGDRVIDPKKWGFMNYYAEEFTSTLGTRKFANFMMETGGFRASDLLGKGVLLNSSHNFLTNMAKKNPEKLFEQVGKFYDEVGFEKLKGDLVAGRLTQDVKTAVFIRSAELQPISRFQQTFKALENPNGRYLYALKSYMITMLTKFKTDGFDMIREGTRRNDNAMIGKGVRNITYLSGVLALSQTPIQQIKGILEGKEPISPEELPANVVHNLFKTFAISDYTLDRIKDDGLVSALLASYAPPYSLFDRVLFTPLTSLLTEGEISEREVEKAMSVSGWTRFYHTWFMGGFENKVERREKRASQDEMKELKETYGYGGSIENYKGYKDGGLVESEDAESEMYNTKLDKQQAEEDYSVGARDLLERLGYHANPFNEDRGATTKPGPSDPDLMLNLFGLPK